MNIQRRKFIIKTAGLAASASVFSLFVPTLVSVAQAQSGPSLTELMKSGPLGEKSEGSDDAAVTIVEYASMTCPHCARFHEEVYPQLKEKYINTGKVRLIMREFPLDRLALAASMLARCSDDKQFFAFVEILYKQQAVWSRSKDPVTELFKVSKFAGFTEERFNECLNNKEVAQGILDVMNRGRDKFKVNSTPTFFINGQKLNGTVPFEDFEKLILPHLKS